MQPQFQLARVLLSLGSLCYVCLLFWLYCFALSRTQLWFFWILVYTSLFSLLLSLINLLLILNTQYAVRLFGEHGFILFYNGYLTVQLVKLFVDLLGTIFFIRWACRGELQKGSVNDS